MGLFQLERHGQAKLWMSLLLVALTICTASSLGVSIRSSFASSSLRSITRTGTMHLSENRNVASFVRGGAAPASSTSTFAALDEIDSDSDDDIYDVTSSSESEYETDDSSSSDAEVVKENRVPAVDAEVVTSKFGDYAAARSKTMEHVEVPASFFMDKTSIETQVRSLKLASVLWLSLALDATLNQKKREVVFGTLVGGGPALVLASATLGAGFVLAAAVSYILSMDLETDNDEDAAVTTDDEGLGLGAQTRLHLSLVAFGFINMGSHLNANLAPYLGLTALFINGHNALVGLNGWKKIVLAMKKENESSSSMVTLSKEWVAGIRSTLKSFLGNTDSEQGRRMLSSFYVYAAVSAVMRLAPVATRLTGTVSLQSVDMAKNAALMWASAARLVLAAGVTLTMKDAVDKKLDDRPLFIYLTGAIAASSSIVSLATLLPALSGVAPMAKDGFMLGLFSIVSSYRCVSQYLKHKQGIVPAS
eukprot:CAMPEP_0198280192 /NCGR_PEP_ID=MMETSP1449-20131203/327_1 /TAXON_ID=420275 /ORGANISM="Attheya septentrionalis, Strain CCMP2084" /LENGTH=476 /DNA_ID=CAMNT_0043975481 /DNA_START=82 /DNA_END=1512 /DNA_ORIENTATION=-